MSAPVEASSPSGRQAGWGLVAAGWAGVALVLVVWLRITPASALRDELRVLQFWWLEATATLVVVCGAWLALAIGRGLSRADLARAATLGVLALAITVAVAPRTNRIFYDEQIYQGIGQNLSDLRKAQMCNDGNVEYGRLQCTSSEYNKQPYAYPHLLSLAYRLVGVGPDVAFHVNAIAAALVPVLVYVLVLLLAADPAAAFYAGLVVALVPEQARWAATAAVEPWASLAAVAALVAAARFAADGDRRSLFATVVLSAYAVQFRTESLLLLPAIGILLLQRRRSEFGTPRFWWAALFALLLLVPHVGHLFAVRNDGWGSPDARLALKYVAQNLAVNGRFYFWDERFPALFGVCALIGLWSHRSQGTRAVMLAYFLAFFGIGLLFYAGSYNYGADVRYSLMTYPPVAILAGFGVAAIVSRLEHGTFVPVGRLATAALAAQWLWYAPLVRATSEEAWAARADVRFAADAAPSLRGNQYVLTHNPAMFHVWGVNAGQMSMVTGNPTYLDYLLVRYPGGVYVHWNFWCNVHDPAQREICERVRAIKPVEAFREYRERDQQFVFYRVAQGTAALPPGAALSDSETRTDTIGR